PLCGDEIDLQLRVDGDVIREARFIGRGCSISQASASMMTQLLKDKPVPQALALAERMTAMMPGDEAAARDKSLGDLRALAGAGKTTTIRMILDIIEPDAGSVRLFGEPSGGRTHTARIGYLPEERGLYRKMRVLDVLVFLAEVKGVERRAARAKATAWLERLGLAAWRLRRIDELSKGMQQKVQFISTILHEPELVILDEPFAGLDPVNTQVVKDAV